MATNNLLKIPPLSDLLPTGMMPSNTFSTSLAAIEIGGKTNSNPVLDIVYNRHGELELFYECKGGINLTFKALESEIVAFQDNQTEPIGLLGLSTQVSDSDSFSIKMMSKKSPFLICNKNEANLVTSYLLNGPDLHPGESVSSYEHDGLILTIKTLDVGRDCRKNIKEHKYDYIVTHKIDLVHSEGKPISSETSFALLNRFRKFLTFVRGGYCGLGHIQGFGDNGELCYSFLGFNKADPFKIAVGWFDLGLTRHVPAIFSKYCSAVDDKENTYVILRAIEFYRASNTISESTKEVAVVSSFAALETLVPHILEHKAGWSVDLIKSNPKFTDMLRAAAGFVHISADLFEHSPYLQKKLKGFTGVDEYGLLGVFRNRIVHQGKPFKYEGIELHEIWEFSQWLVEVFIFYLINYDEQMNDRRKYTGWRGGSVSVPIRL